MAIEDAIVYGFAEIPALVLAKILGRSFSLTPRRARSVATFIFFALILGACFLAWFLYQRQ
jgi:predicted permease